MRIYSGISESQISDLSGRRDAPNLSPMLALTKPRPPPQPITHPKEKGDSSSRRPSHPRPPATEPSKACQVRVRSGWHVCKIESKTQSERMEVNKYKGPTGKHLYKSGGRFLDALERSRLLLAKNPKRSPPRNLSVVSVAALLRSTYALCLTK